MKPCGEKKMFKKHTKSYGHNKTIWDTHFLHYHTRTYNQCKMSLTYHSGPHQI